MFPGSPWCSRRTEPGCARFRVWRPHEYCLGFPRFLLRCLYREVLTNAAARASARSRHHSSKRASEMKLLKHRKVNEMRPQGGKETLCPDKLPGPAPVPPSSSSCPSPRTEGAARSSHGKVGQGEPRIWGAEHCTAGPMGVPEGQTSQPLPSPHRCSTDAAVDILTNSSCCCKK